MPSAELENLTKIKKLKTEPGSQSEFDGLLRSGQRRLADALKTSLSAESRFDLAYNAAHAFALAALRWHGYRSDNRYIVFQCLPHTLGLANEKWRVLDQAHNKRNLAEYEGDTDVDDSLLEAVLRIAQEVGQLVSRLGVVP